jgi:hypothetical protein
MRAGDGSPDEMRHVPRLSDRHALDAATAEGLLAGRGVPGDSPTGQQVLACMLEVAARPPGDGELSRLADAVAGFSGARQEARRRSRRLARLTLASAVSAVAIIGGGALAGALPARFQEVAHVTFGAPAPHHDVSGSWRGSQRRHLTGGPGFQQQSVPRAGLGPGQTAGPEPARAPGPGRHAPARPEHPATTTKHPAPTAEGVG